MKPVRFASLRNLCAASLVMLLAACGQDAPTEPEAPPAPPPPATFVWHAIAPSTFDIGPPVTLQLSERYSFAVFPDTAVFPGETLTARYTLEGEAGRVVRVVLIRHCDGANGDEYAEQYVTLTGSAQSGEVSRTFEQYYSCVRVSFHSHDSNPLSVTVRDLSLTSSGAPQ